jgi:hypothetical protein
MELDSFPAAIRPTSGNMWSRGITVSYVVSRARIGTRPRSAHLFIRAGLVGRLGQCQTLVLLHKSLGRNRCIISRRVANSSGRATNNRMCPNWIYGPGPLETSAN